MNREIKFRAWDNVEKRMRDYNEVSIILNSNDLRDLNSNGRKLNLNFIIQGLNMEGLTILQYTGLKDKNGKEIYEGDIVKWMDGPVLAPWNPRIAVVEFTPGLTFYAVNVASYEDTGRHGAKPGFGHGFGIGNFIYRDRERRLEIIGNVFENHSLIK